MLTRRELVLINKIETEIENRKELIVSGAVKDYTELRENIGYIDGLKLSIVLINEIDQDESGHRRENQAAV